LLSVQSVSAEPPASAEDGEPKRRQQPLPVGLQRPRTIISAAAFTTNRLISVQGFHLRVLTVARQKYPLHLQALGLLLVLAGG